MHNIKLKQLN